MLPETDENKLPEKKSIRVCVLVNVLTSVNSFIYHNHINMLVYTAKRRPDIEILFDTPHRSSIDRARNEAAEYALSCDCDYLVFLDDDVMVPRNSLIRLIETAESGKGYDVVAGLVIIRGYPFDVMAFKYDQKKKSNLGFYNNLPKKNGKLKPLVKCDAVGFSLCLIKTSLLKEVSTPFFVTGSGCTEDVYFCMKAQKEVPGTSIVMRTDLQCGHLMNNEPVEWNNRKKLKAFYDEEVMANLPKGRGLEYILRNISNLGEGTPND